MSRALAFRSLRLAQVLPGPLAVCRVTKATAAFHALPARRAAATLNSDIISQITDREKKITGKDGPSTGGPTAQAQKHVGQQLTSTIVLDIAKGEQVLTGRNDPTLDGPAAFVQSLFDSEATATTSTEQHSGVLDSDTISKITEAEKKLTGSGEPAPGGPTAQAQKHANEPIGSQNLHDITEGEKKVTGGERVKGGPTSTAQSELGKSRAGS